MNIWKRNAVVSVMVLFVCVALYLSWSYGREPDGDGTKVFDPGSVSQETTQDLDAAGSAEDSDFTGIEIDDADGDDYFAQARLTRKSARDSAISILNEAADREDVSQEIKDNALNEVEKLAQYALSEATIENLIIAKGFSECVAIIGQDGINIVVAAPVGGLNAEDAAKITDIVLDNSAFTALNIKIVPVEA